MTDFSLHEGAGGSPRVICEGLGHAVCTQRVRESLPAVSIVIGSSLAVRVNRHQWDVLNIAVAAPSPRVPWCVWRRSVQHSRVGSHRLCPLSCTAGVGLQSKTADAESPVPAFTECWRGFCHSVLWTKCQLAADINTQVVLLRVCFLVHLCAIGTIQLTPAM